MVRDSRIKNIKVGIYAILSFVLVIAAYAYIHSIQISGRSYDLDVIFNDAQGVDTGAPVMMSGVKIGQVKRVSLTDANKALITVRIRADQDIPPGSAARLASSSLLGDRYIEFVPGPPSSKRMSPGETLVGIPAITLDDLLPQVSRLMDRLESVGASAQSLLDDKQLRLSLDSTMKNLDAASAGAVGLVNDLRSITASNRTPVQAMTSNLAAAMGNLNAAIAQINSMMQGGRKEDIQNIVANLKSASRQIEAASTHASEAAANAASLTGDPQMRQDLQQSMQNVRETTESAKAIVDRVAQVVGVKQTGTATKSPAARPKPPSGLGLKVDTLFDADRGKSRIDANYDFRLGGDKFYRVGVFDIGETPRVNAQVGKVLKSGDSLRGGLYQSRLDLGYDWQAGGLWTVHGDLYRPNDPRLDVKALRSISPDMGAWIGIEGIGGGKDGNRPVLGLQFKF
ncbi:MAG: MCE family protein [Armatimonadetes bacterium]|nr:MCE family protein [Armatimonadota bacterium]